MIVAGIGCSAGATGAEIGALVALVAQGRGLDALACLEMRAGQLRAVAQELGLPLLLLAGPALRGVATPSHSARIMADYGTGSVAEACALLAAGTGARIITARQISDARQATCALAEGRGI
jgi:cobalt-precorrin 5A hydrolase